MKTQRLRLSSGRDLSYSTAGDPGAPALLLLHGTPNSSRMFRQVAPALAQVAHVIAPDLPGHGASDPMPDATFHGIGEAIVELLDRLGVGPRYIYLHDWGTPVGLHVAMDAPEQVLGLIVQNANAHRSGWGPGWAATRAYWERPTPALEAEVTAHLSLEGTRDTYVSGVPAEVAACIPAAHWEEDWRVMQLPGHLDTQRALIADYGRYAERFDDIAAWLERHQPPALMVWGRHDIYFELDEVLSWMRALPRMEAHVLDAGHLLLETHAQQAASLMVEFIRRNRASAETDAAE
ncbi:alpha/beta fold hydrolase [Luteimonas saliphila]|uniref:alpha/beta fold hydrolase n=1 Tax=Luteimonas saliphila TaxID=2804919 RepID=UPI00192D730F|nr:alpha/beta hydrolase [Luteimonas saliphila]